MTPEEYNRVFNLPFKEAETFFRNKLNIPTEKWDDLWKEQHAKGFMVAGAQKAELLSDFRASVQKAIDGGMTKKEFQSRFDEIVKEHGWSYKGSRNWRSELIYSTNIRTAYQAGRWQQLTVPGSKTPYLVYRHSDSGRHPRPLHVSWNGLILPASHDFWKSHYPPNGWGCRCTCFAASEKERQAAIAGGKGEPPEGYNTITEQEIRDKDGNLIRIKRTRPGIDEGWDYNVGSASEKSYEGLANKFEKLPADIAKGWMNEFVKQPPFERFIAGNIKGNFPVAVLDDKDKAALQTSAQTVWFSSVSLQEHLVKHPDITLEDYRLIQQVLDEGEVYFRPKKGRELERLIYLQNSGKLYRAAVKTTEDKNENFFLTLFETTEEAIKRQEIRGLEKVR